MYKLNSKKVKLRPSFFIAFLSIKIVKCIHFLSSITKDLHKKYTTTYLFFAFNS